MFAVEGNDALRLHGMGDGNVGSLTLAEAR